MSSDSRDQKAAMEQLQSAYSSSDQRVRNSFGNNREQAEAHFQNLVNFILIAAPPAPPARTTKLLDVGCGNGWSSHCFAKAGYDATGIDLNPAAFEPPPEEGMNLLFGSATEIPFPDEAFDVVLTYQCLEHVPAPERAIEEMIRVCKPGGVVAVVGPNLVSPTVGLLYAAKPSTWPKLIFRRKPETPRHPYGNTVGEIASFSVLRTAQLLGKLISRNPAFLMRTADTMYPFHADSDACYLCNPTDLIRAFQRRGLHVMHRGRPGRFPGAYLFAGGTWVAARKLN